ncbi:NAD(+) diphosphatase [Aestuariimicrobium soli]|uniref:NAD(+) diphosphatase n=1 Tax=Aestuariimicrobium soli TaxID=2035834 RepID=UPI003EB9C9F2
MTDTAPPAASTALNPSAPFILILDRRADLRSDEAALAGQWARPEAQLVSVTTAGGLASIGPTGGTHDPARHIFLGVAEDRPWFAVEVRDPQSSGTGSGAATRTLREGGFSALEEELLTAAVAVLAWHRLDPRCERCAGHTRPVEGGFVRQCLECGAQLFPRTDPAMIVVLLDPGTSVVEERLLLAHQASWPPHRMSLLAGFVEAGESLEASVVREVAEEAQLAVTGFGYLASQPWPFPRSLMLGCVATVAPAPPVVDGVELDEARWFTRAQMDEAVASGELVLSAPGSIARRLIEGWRAGQITAAHAGVPVVTLPITGSSSTSTR